MKVHLVHKHHIRLPEREREVSVRRLLGVGLVQWYELSAGRAGYDRKPAVSVMVRATPRHVDALLQVLVNVLGG